MIIQFLRTSITNAKINRADPRINNGLVISKKLLNLVGLSFRERIEIVDYIKGNTYSTYVTPTDEVSVIRITGPLCKVLMPFNVININVYGFIDENNLNEQYSKILELDDKKMNHPKKMIYVNGHDEIPIPVSFK